MKKLLLLFVLLSVIAGCKNTFIDDYNKFVAQQQMPNGETPDQATDYFVKISDDEGLLVVTGMPFPTEVRATQNRYPDKIDITWKAVILPPEAASVSYSVYRKNSQDDSSAWVRIADGLTECKWTDNAYAASETPGTGEGSEPTDPGTEGDGTADTGTPSAEPTGDGFGQTAVLLEGEEYHYAVRAVYTVKISDKQSIIKGSRLSYYASGTLFRNIWNIRAQYRDNLNQIAVSWTAVPGAESYDVYRADVSDEGTGEYQLKASVSALTYIDYADSVVSGDAGVPSGQEYRYRIIPYYMDGEKKIEARLGSSTLSILGAVLAVGAPTAPVVKSVSEGLYGGGIKIEWEPQPGMQFRVYRAVSKDAPFEPIAMTDVDAVSYMDTLSDVPANRRFGTYYYKVSARNASGVDGQLSVLDEVNHKGYGFFLEEGRISASKRVYPQQIDLIFDFKTTPLGDAFYVQYTEDDGATWNWVKNDGSVSPVSDGTFTLDDGLATDVRKVVVQIPNYNQSGTYKFRICAAKKSLIEGGDVSKIFVDGDTELLGRSNGIETTAGLEGPEIPVLTVSQGDSSVGVNKIKVSGKWDGLAEYGDHVDIKIVRYYSFGKDSASTSEPIAVKEKVIADWGSVTISNGEFSITDNLAPDINPTADTIKPMNASIAKGATWTYWTWDREAWKYINRKMPFDMKAAVGCEYKIVARWKNAGSEWPESESIDTTYGYPAISNDDFAHLVLWMREVAMNRLWHLLYPPYLGTLSTIVELLPSPQSKAGEYGGQVGYTAKVDGLGGSGECWINNYSDWGPEWNINIARFPIAIQFGSTIDFDMNIDIKTPLYDGSAHVIVTLENGMYVDKPRGGSMEVKQADGRSQKYENLQNNDSIILRYFPPEGYEKRVLNDTDSTPSYELTTINFKYPITQWESTRSEDWTMYYGFEFE